MKTTIDISDALLLRAKRYARKSGTTLRTLVEEGLRRVLKSEGETTHFRLTDRSVGRQGDANPLENFSWQDLRDEIYGGHKV